MEENGLKLNIGKTQAIVIGMPNDIAKVGQIKINFAGQEIVSSDTLKTLGLTLDPLLTFRNHINGLSIRFHLMAKSLFPLKPLMSFDNLVLLTNACVISLTDYMAGIWGTANKQHLQKVEKAMKSVARRLYNLTKFDSVSGVINNELKWLMPEQRYLLKTVSFVHQTLTDNKITHFEGLLMRNNELHSHNTRSANHIHINTRPTNSISNRSVQVRPVSVYNNLPLDIKECETAKSFRKKLKTYLLNSQ
jgi:hypothetical protein